MAEAPSIECRDLCKRYGQRGVVNGVGLRVPAGSIYGLLGPNGAGKTTLLRMVMGLVRPTSGSIQLFGRYPPGHPEARRRIGYMPQGMALYPNLSVRENVRFFGRLYGVGGDPLRDRVERLIDLVDLRSHADASVETLSGGMARRAMLATTLVHEPRLLILDEPTAGIDPALRLRFWAWFEQLSAGGVSIIVTTHHIAEASRAGQVLFLRAGEILDTGTPAELMERHHAHDLEAAFVHATEPASATAGADGRTAKTGPA